MRLISLSLRGAIGIREGLGLDEIRIMFDDIEPGIVAFVAPNGHGKTTILENLHPFRKLVSRDGKLADHFYLRDSHRILEWEQGGHVYTAKLLLDGVKGAAESYLYRDGEPLNDGKNTTYDKAVSEIVGNEDLFFSSLFRSQNAESITSMTAGERKRLLSALLGFERYETLRAMADERLKSVQAEAAKLETRRAVVVERQQERMRIQQELNSQEDRLRSLRREHEEIVVPDIETLQQQKAKLDAENEQLKSRENEITRRESVLDTDDDNIRLAPVLAAEKDLAEAEAKRDRLQKITANADAIHAGLTHIAELEQAIQSEQERKAMHEAAVAARRDIVLRTDARTETAKRFAEDEQRKLADVERAMNDSGEQLKAATAAAERLTEVPCAGMNIQAGCSLMRHTAEVAATREEMERQFEAALGAYKVHLFRVEDALAMIEKSEGDARTELDLYDIGMYDDLKWTPEDLGRYRRILTAEKAKNWPDIDRELAGATAALAELEVSIERLRATAVERRSEYEQQKRQRAEERASLRSDWKAVEELRDELMHERAAAQVSIRKAQDVLDRRRDIETKIASIEGGLTVLHARIKDLADTDSERTAIDADLALMNADAMDWSFLSRACSPKGIPALELDAAGPRISDIANDLLSSTFGSEFRIEFETTRLTQSGDQTEAFEIMVYSGDEARKIELLSGGQRVWIEAAISQAISLYIREQSGLDLRTSFLDEADGALDSDNAFKYLSMLRASHNRSGAHHTIVITHRQELLSLIPSQLHLVRGEGVVVR